jgi:ubiquinone/menaquinone biosynthesis C-methylase UbiE
MALPCGASSKRSSWRRDAAVTIYERYIFPRLQALVSRRFEARRRELFAHARGRVLELGVGTGQGLDAYPGEVTEVVAIDPAEAMLRHAARRLAELGNGGRRLPYRVTLERADAQALPYGDASFDTVVAFLTLCTIPDPVQAAREAHRVLRPGGRLLVLEHVRAGTGGALARWQDSMNPVWNRLAGGCNLNRDTAATLARAGFDTGPLSHFREQRLFPLASPRIRGVLRRP